MHSLADNIASNSILQAVSILVAVASVVVFLWKNVPPAIRFGLDYITKGRVKAFMNLNRSVARLAIRDSSHPALITLTLSLLQYKAIKVYFLITNVGVFTILVYLFFDVNINSPIFYETNPFFIVASLVFGLLIGIATGFALIRPIERYFTYIRWARRLSVKVLVKASAEAAIVGAP